MEETGVVKSIQGPFSVVLVTKKSACEHCTAGTCHLSDDGAELEALNEAGAQVGQRVRVILRPMDYVKGSMMVYGIPALALIIGAIVGKEYGPRIIPLDADLVSAIFAFGSLGLSLLLVKLWLRSAEKETKYRPVITEILSE